MDGLAQVPQLPQYKPEYEVQWTLWKKIILDEEKHFRKAGYSHERWNVHVISKHKNRMTDIGNGRRKSLNGKTQGLLKKSRKMSKVRYTYRGAIRD